MTCHNPGSWVAGTPNVPVDFKVMIHKIHDGASLPSVLAGTPYVVNGTDFSKVVFPQDVRNCTKCHDGTPGASNATAQGDNWKMQPSMQACGACHDDVYFGTKPDPAKPYQTIAHPGGVMTDNSACALCHAAGRFTDNKDIVVAHNFPTRLAAAAAKFKYNIISVTPTTAGSKPVITFSVTDPTNADAPYDIKAAAAFTAGGNSTLTVKLGWSTSDFGNDDSGQAFGQPVSINLLGNAAVAAGATPGTYTVTSTVAIPATQTGTLRVMMDGHPAGDVTTAGTFTDRLPVTSVFKDFAITGAVTRAPGSGRHRQVRRMPRRAESARQQPHRRAGRVRGLPQPERDRRGPAPDTAGVLTGGVRRQAGRVDRLQDHDPRHPCGRIRQGRVPHQGDHDLWLRRQRERFQRRGLPRKIEQLLELPRRHVLPADGHLGRA